MIRDEISILATTIPTDDVRFLTKGLHEFILITFIDQDDSKAWK